LQGVSVNEPMNVPVRFPHALGLITTLSDFSSQGGGTALHQAAFGNKHEVVDFLIKNKADLEAETNVNQSNQPSPYDPQAL